MTGPLLLQAREFRDAASWRWVLTDESGVFLADHEVRLDPAAWQVEALADLQGYLSWHVAPDRRAADEERVLAELGDWIAEYVLGGPVGRVIARARPATVQVSVPPGQAAATGVLLLPLEAARVGGRPLAASGVTFVRQVTTDSAPPKTVGHRLRILGLFSLPDGRLPLNLGRERHALARLVQGTSALGKAVDIRVLQYGVTRELLRDVLEEGEGWDIIHISGHGAPGELLLEKADGTADPVSADALARLLAPARDRAKLITLAASWSAALTVADQRRVLGLSPSRAQERAPDRADTAGETSVGALAAGLAGQLGCPVLAMRYPVSDEFALQFFDELYQRLMRGNQPLPDMVGRVLRQLAGGASPVSVISPVLFGAGAVNLRLTAPDRGGPADYSTDRLKMAGFPPPPDRFVGRTGTMARANAALAARSGVPGVVLHGMPGAGKTACALELAYGHEHAFEQLVWYKAPDDGMDTRGALTDFALTLEQYLPGLQLAHLLADPAGLGAFLPRLTEFMERRRLLIVIDNVESLLSRSGQWRDERWRQLIDALCAHSGAGRLIITTQWPPAGPRLLVEAVDALSADESLLLIRELPNLRRLTQGEVPGIEPGVARQLALGVLSIAQGHPKLLELADGQAEYPERLAALVAAGDQAWREQGGLPERFFAGSGASASAGDYWHLLAVWTETVAGTLSKGERDLFWFLCCLEEPDREQPVLDGNWADLRTRLHRDEEGPGLDEALAALVASGLAAQSGAEDGGQTYVIHPAVAATGRKQAGLVFQEAVDTEAATFWYNVYQYAAGEVGDGTVSTGLLVRAGLAAIPYFLRLEQWDTAAHLLERAFVRDPSRANAAALLPAIQRLAGHDERYAVTLALVQQVTDPAAAEATLRTALGSAVASGDYARASVAAGRLADLCAASGRLTEALALAERKAEYTREAGLGPWTELADQARRLQVLTAMGQAGQVLAEVSRLRGELVSLPATAAASETATPWIAREMLLDTGHSAAVQLGRWEDALDLSAALLASLRERGAPVTDVARARFNDYGPLLRLGRSDEALRLLIECRQVFQDGNDIEMLGRTLTALASTEAQRGHGEAAILMERDALRYNYLAGNVPSIAVSYHNLGGYLYRHAGQPGPALACHLTAALVSALTGVGDARNSVLSAVNDLRDLGPAARLPSDVASLDAAAGEIPGTDLPGLITALAPDLEAAEQALRAIVSQVRRTVPGPVTRGADPGSRPPRVNDDGTLQWWDGTEWVSYEETYEETIASPGTVARDA